MERKVVDQFEEGCRMEVIGEAGATRWVSRPLLWESAQGKWTRNEEGTLAMLGMLSASKFYFSLLMELSFHSS